MKKNAMILGAALSVWLAGTASAATQLNGFDIYVTGNRQTDNTAGGIGGFSPGTGTGPGSTVGELRMYDDGATNGDAVADDGIWTCILPGLNPGDLLQWKVAAAGFPPGANTPNDNNAVLVPAGGTVEFYLQTNAQNDDYIPDAGAGSAPDGFVYTDQTTSMIAGYTTIEATGSFQDELSFGTDWTAATAPVLTDAAVGTTGDGLLGLVLTGVPCGSYSYKLTTNQSFDPSWGQSGLSFGGGNLSWSSPGDGDTVTITLETTTGRVKTESLLTSSASAGPPFYATSSPWGVCLDSNTELIASGNTYQRVFTVATAGTYSARVRQGVGPSFADTGDYPYTTTTNGQTVRVIFDRNAYADGYSPSTDFVVILDDTTRAPLNVWDKVQPVGDWQTDFGSTNWNGGEAALDLVDDGTGTDAVSGDAIYAKSFQAFASATGKQYKAVGQRTGAGDTGFTIQFGGANDGLTTGGNNGVSLIDYTNTSLYTFVVDTATGRIGYFLDGTATLPARGAYFSASSDVRDWTMY